MIYSVLYVMQATDYALQADTQNRATYLESSNGINPLIYAKLGFEMRKDIHLTRGDKPIKLDIMVREPTQPSGKSDAE